MVALEDAQGGGGAIAAPAPVAPVQYPTVTPCHCQCQTNHWAAFAIVRYSNSVIRLVKRNDFHRLLATFFGFFTVIFVLTSGGQLLHMPAFRYLLSTGIIAVLYSVVQLSEGIWEIATGECLPSWLSGRLFCYGAFAFDLVLAYLLLSSSSVAVLAVDHGRRSHYYWREPNWAMARCSIAWSFFTFFFVAMSSLLSGYKLCKKIIWASVSYTSEVSDAIKSAVETAARDDADGSDVGDANPSHGNCGTGTPVPIAPQSPAPSTALTVGHVLGSPPSSASLLQYRACCQRHTNYLASDLAISRCPNNVLQLIKRKDVRCLLATVFSFLTIIFLLASRLLGIPAFRYLLSTGIMAFLYSAVRLTESMWKTATKSYHRLSDNALHFGTFIIDLVLSYLLLSSSSVGVLGLDHRRKFDHYYGEDSRRTLACIGVVWSFATFVVVAISSLFSGSKLCKRIICAPVSTEFDDANKSWPDSQLAA